ncbi:unnamed protein product, partial [Ceratitis capitata]
MWLIFSSLFVLAANNIRVCSLDQLESENDLAEVATGCPDFREAAYYSPHLESSLRHIDLHALLSENNDLQSSKYSYYGKKSRFRRILMRPRSTQTKHSVEKSLTSTTTNDSAPF